MAHQIEYNIVGSDLQAVEIELDPSEAVRAEPGSMLYMEDGIEMQTNNEGGVFKGLKRMFMGEGFFVTNFINTSNQKRKLAFAAPYPGTILALDLNTVGNEFICQKDSFLCAAQGIEVEISFNKKLGAGLFGGEGFILQKLSGDGLAFIHTGGFLMQKTLKEGETLRVDTGCLAGFTTGVAYDIKFVGGFKNTVFGGEGLFYATLTGPGTVYLQTLPFSRVADSIARTINRGRQTGEGSLLGKTAFDLLGGK
jgi:uncharacterized protein (TIGR00266 family)